MSYRIRWAVEMLTAAVRGRADSHSQERADDEARATAGYVSDLDVKATMFRIANKYDRLRSASPT
jgi:hypothetical protein